MRSSPFSEAKVPEAAVLHFTYAKFSDLTSRRDRCGCKPNTVDVQKCFMLDFDRSVRGGGEGWGSGLWGLSLWGSRFKV